MGLNYEFRNVISCYIIRKHKENELKIKQKYLKI